MTKIILTGNPLSNQTIYKYTCRGKFGTLYMTQKGKERKKQYREEVLAQYKGKVSDELFSIAIKYYFGDHRVRDWDNFAKLINDSLEGIVMVNDKQIRKVKGIDLLYDKENPRTEIILEKLSTDKQ